MPPTRCRRYFHRFFARLTPDASAGVANRAINAAAAIAVVTIAFVAISYTLPKVLPASFFEPVSRAEYALAIAKMTDPYRLSDPFARFKDKFEPYPGFPYYSRESDHPSAWPARVWSDKTKLADAYKDLLTHFNVLLEAPRQRAGDSKQSQMSSLGISNASERARIEVITNLRLWFNETLNGDEAALKKAVGADAANAFLGVEESRAALRKDLPNRFAVLRIKNTGRKDVQDLTLEIEIFGKLYDYAIDADERYVYRAEYEQASHRIVIGRILPGTRSSCASGISICRSKPACFPTSRTLFSN